VKFSVNTFEFLNILAKGCLSRAGFWEEVIELVERQAVKASKKETIITQTDDLFV
jgi:hypothetical protein